jgi:hypothetical protein
VQNEPVVLGERRYYKNGLVRTIESQALAYVGDFRGIPLFGEAGVAIPDLPYVFVPAAPGCMFQPYVYHADVGPVSSPGR